MCSSAQPYWNFWGSLLVQYFQLLDEATGTVDTTQSRCTKEQIQGWVFNRFYYQIMIPIKDSAVLSNMPEKDHRKLWIQRILDHDGIGDDEGGIEAWISLGEAVGLKREDIN